MKRYTLEEYVLGVTATARNVHAILVQETDGGPVIVRQFHRTIGESQAFAPLTPEMSDNENSDISFNITDSNPGGMFMAGEFGAGDPSASFDGGNDLSSDSAVQFQATTKFDLELLDIITECQESGYENFRIAFAIGSGFLRTAEIKARSGNEAVTDEGEETKSSILNFKRGRGGKQSVEGVFSQKFDGEFDPGKGCISPNAVDDAGMSKALAVFATGNEPVEPTLQTIRDRKRTTPPIELLDNEITLFIGLARAAERRNEDPTADGQENRPTLLVRAGTEDTIVMFVSGDELVRFENLRSITAFDPPETICSRVLLLQDEFGLGDAGTVVLLGESAKNLWRTASGRFSRTPRSRCFATTFQNSEVKTAALSRVIRFWQQQSHFGSSEIRISKKALSRSISCPRSCSGPSLSSHLPGRWRRCTRSCSLRRCFSCIATTLSSTRWSCTSMNWHSIQLN